LSFENRYVYIHTQNPVEASVMGTQRRARWGSHTRSLQRR